jgi:hypothetical protein
MYPMGMATGQVYSIARMASQGGVTLQANEPGLRSRPEPLPLSAEPTRWPQDRPVARTSLRCAGPHAPQSPPIRLDQVGLAA